MMTLMALDVKKLLLEQLDWHWNKMLMPRLRALTDDEYMWEPYPGSWSIRREDDGSWQKDRGNPIAPEPEPLTTIAWRMAHIVEMLMRRSANQFGAKGYVPDTAGTADEAVARMRSGYSDWMGGLEALDAAELERPSGSTESQPDWPLAALVQHMNRELIHHGAEICLLRDLYRARQLAQPAIQALLRGDEAGAPLDVSEIRSAHPDLIRQAVQLGSEAGVRLLGARGFDVNADVARPALHAAAAAGNVGMCTLLIELGADLTQRDNAWRETPLGWAKWCKQDDTIAYLEPMTPPDEPR